jgi:hypothetical protein
MVGEGALKLFMCVFLQKKGLVKFYAHHQKKVFKDPVKRNQESGV